MTDGCNRSHIERIDGLIMQIGEQLNCINPINPEQQNAKDIAFEEINNYQLNQLDELRKAFD